MLTYADAMNKKQNQKISKIYHISILRFTNPSSKVQTNILVTVTDPLFAPTHNSMI